MLTTLTQQDTIDYPISDSNLPFSDYIAASRLIIQNRRPDVQAMTAASQLILNANSPYELYPSQPTKYGVLLIHGLLDCPFSLRDLGMQLQANGIVCKAILLPGHGTRPEDLLTVTYQEWIQALQYGVANLRKEVDKLFIVGYSTGASLAVYQALQDAHIAGIILLAPAIRIKAPVNLITSWHYLKKWLRISHNEWINKDNEIDYTKYSSITFNAAKQVVMLTDVLRDLRAHHAITCPIFMSLSQEDETISSHDAIQFFSHFQHPKSKLLLYTAKDHHYADHRIITRITYYPELHIQHLSHIGIPFSPANMHYGQYGDYEYASHINSNCIYGAYGWPVTQASALLYKLKLTQHSYRTLTYNPDFDYMAKQIMEFIFA